MAVVDLFRALGEPTRLEMVERLSHRDSHTLTSLSHGLALTRQGARKHIQILADAHLIKLIEKGRTTTIQLDRTTLDTGKAFIAHLEKQWDQRLDALRAFVEKQ